MRRVEGGRGAAVLTVVLATGAFLAGGLSVEAARLLGARFDARRAAREGARAAAVSLLASPGDEDTARAMAVRFARATSATGERNGAAAMVTGRDVRFDPASSRISVTARRDRRHGNEVPLLFARWFMASPEIAATATAGFEPGGAVTCVRPWALPDAWEDRMAPVGRYDRGDVYARNITSWGTDYRGSERDHGTVLRIRPTLPGDAVTTESWFPFVTASRESVGSLEGRYREGAVACRAQALRIDDRIRIVTWEEVDPDASALRALVNLDAEAFWDAAAGSVRGSVFPPGASPRVARVAFFDPDAPPTDSRRDVRVVNIGAVFIEAIDEDGTAVVRLMATAGTPAPGRGALIRSVSLQP